MTDSPVHLAGKRSREAAVVRDKEAWLAVFADDAVVEDPIGPSHFDPEGKGHRGKAAIAKFYDMAIAPSELTFNFTKTYQCGDEEANVGNIVMPWVFDGLGFDAPLAAKQDSVKRFADTYIHSGWQD